MLFFKGFGGEAAETFKKYYTDNNKNCGFFPKTHVKIV